MLTQCLRWRDAVRLGAAPRDLLPPASQWAWPWLRAEGLCPGGRGYSLQVGQTVCAHRGGSAQATTARPISMLCRVLAGRAHECGSGGRWRRTAPLPQQDTVLRRPALRQQTRGRHSDASSTQHADVVIVGGGHNGLVAATLLARANLKVTVLEAADMIGGACRTEYPFPKVPGLGHSSGAYLLGVMPPELLRKLGLDLPLVRRDPHYFLPTTEAGRHILFGSDAAAMQQQFEQHFSRADWDANCRMNEELAGLREDLAPAWLQEPYSLEETAERFVRPALRAIFVDLCTRPVADYLERFAFQSDLLKAMYATTDGFSGLSGGWDSPGTGLNFLAHNMCRLGGADGTWMVVRGGMGTVTQRLAAAAAAAGATVTTGARVEQVLAEEGHAAGVRVAGPQGQWEVRAKAVLVNADPFRTRALLPPDAVPAAFGERIDSLKKEGLTMKVNLALKGLPRFKCLPGVHGQHRGTMHLLPQHDVIDELRRGYKDACEGRLPEFPTIEWYIHTAPGVDPSLSDTGGHHSSAFFVQWVPHTPKGSSWEAEEGAYVEHLLSIADRFAPGTSDLVADTFTLTPPKIESHFGITGGHIHHVDNSFGFDQRVPYRWPLDGLYSCSAGTHPAGSVAGAAGHNASQVLLRDLGLPAA